VHVYVHGQQIVSWRVASPGVFAAVIPRQLVGRDGVIFIDFHVPGAASPEELRSGSDTRRLGVKCSEMTIARTDRATDYALGTIIRFGSRRGAERYEVNGWSKAEPEFTWTEGTSAALQLQMPSASGRLALHARMRGIATSADVPFQPTDVYVNGQKVAHWDVGAPAEFQAAIPPEVACQNDALMIEFRTPLAVSPSALGANADTRVLGVCVFELQVTGES
jgi:hypothetical protein